MTGMTSTPSPTMLADKPCTYSPSSKPSDEAVPELDDISCMTHSESESTFSSHGFQQADISVVTPTTVRDQTDIPQKVFLGTFRKNLGTLGSIVVRERRDDDDEEEESNSGPLSTFARNMSTIGGTFTRNLGFASRQIRTLQGLSKTVDLLQEHTRTMSEDMGNLQTFSKNVDFAQAKAQSLTQDIAASRGGTALRSCLKKGTEESSRVMPRVSWTDGYKKDSNYVGIGISKAKPVLRKTKNKQPPQFAPVDPMPLTVWSEASIQFENMDLVKGPQQDITTTPVVNGKLEEAKLAYARQALENDRRWRAMVQEQQTKRRQKPVAA